LSKVAMRSGSGTKSGLAGSVTRPTKSRIADLAFPSFQDGSGSVAVAAWSPIPEGPHARRAIDDNTTAMIFSVFMCHSLASKMAGPKARR
jgi:hypothetical protein